MQTGVSHPAMEAFNVYIAQSASWCLDLTFMENAPGFPEELFVGPMTDAGCVVVHFKFGPEDCSIKPCRSPCAVSALGLFP